MQSGYGFGVWVGLLTALGAEIRLVNPRVWKHASGLTGKDKVGARTIRVVRREGPVRASGGGPEG
eukprot:902753-Prorocentrum_minimum.AAC.1